MPTKEYEGVGGFIYDGADDSGAFAPDTEGDDVGDGGFIPDTKGQHAIPGMSREYSFESAILDSQTLRPRRRSSFGEAYSSNDDGAGGGFLPGDYVDDDDDDDGDRPTGHEDAVDHAGGAKDEDGGFIREDSSDKEDEASLSHQPASKEEDVPVSGKSCTPTSSPSEAGSLPLEDPEDEDADPDWLVDAT